MVIANGQLIQTQNFIMNSGDHHAVPMMLNQDPIIINLETKMSSHKANQRFKASQDSNHSANRVKEEPF